MYKLKLLRNCRVCLEKKLFCKPLFDKVLDKYLPLLIKNICAVELSEQDDPDSVVCLECAIALIQAENIIAKFLSSHEILQKQKEIIKEEETEEEEGIDEYIKYDNKTDIIEEEQVESLEGDVQHTEPYDDEPDAPVPSSTKNRYLRMNNEEQDVTVNRKNDLHFICDLCGYESDFVKTFRNHMIEVHKVERPQIFKCEHCSGTYVEHTSLQEHTARVHVSEPPTLKFLCSECGKGFNRHSHLVRHSYVHKPDKMPFSCKMCPKLFASRSNMQRHILAHHSERKLHSCEICERKFSDVYVLKSHKKRVHHWT